MTTHKRTLDSSASSLALSPDFSQVVIAGSHIFKIFTIDEGELTERVNLYAAKNLNPLFSSSDVVWNPIEENKIATVANNGAVVTWDLKKSTRSKLENVFKDHERPVNKISYHPQESHLLISGDKDGIMKLFDTRRREAVTTFISNAESVRDIQFSPHMSNYFAAGTENGNVQFWDMRRSDRTERQFTGHRGPIFALDWHPEDKRWIATASRDHTIKLKNLQDSSSLDLAFSKLVLVDSSSVVFQYGSYSEATRTEQGEVWVWDVDEPYSIYKSIKTVAAVGRVKWRPNRKFHLASCALATDCSISVWDIRRPYIPFSAFPEHRDVTTGIAWQGNCQVLLSVGKDNTLYCHSFEDATHPIENTNPFALDINPVGIISFAKPIDEQILLPLSPAGRPTNIKHSQKMSNYDDNFSPVFSTMNVFNTDIDESPTSSAHIIESACNYRLTGRSFNEICEHNAAVAKKLNRQKVALTWQILQVLYGGTLSLGTSVDYPQNFSSKEDARTDTAMDNDLKPVRHISGETIGDSVGTGVISGEEAETETDDPDNPDLKLLNIASGVTMSYDFFFGDELSQIHFDYDNLNNVNPCHDWTLPNEAFQPRREITYQPTTPPEDFPPSTPLSKDDLNMNEESRRNHQYDYVMCASLKLLDPKTVSTDAYEYGPIVVDMMKHYATTGDIQMAVTLVIILGDRVRNLLDERMIEHWFLSYIEILHKLSLWNTATLIIKHANFLPQIQQINQQSTSVRVQCGCCDHSMLYGKQFCGKCSNIPSRCSICHCVVQGLFVWCQGCSHGGHLAHILEWMQNNPSCPTGCGHYCEYT